MAPSATDAGSAQAPQRAGLGGRVAGALVRRREASIGLVAVALLIYFSLRTDAFFVDPRNSGFQNALAQNITTQDNDFSGRVMPAVGLDYRYPLISTHSWGTQILEPRAQVILRRLREGRPIYQADRLHVHHRLLAHGLTQVQTLAVLYGVSFLLSMVSLLLYWWVVG